MAKKKSSEFEAFIGAIILLLMVFSWLTIPDERGDVDGLRITSLAFMNAIFDGWADDIAVELFHSGSGYAANHATDAFKNAILRGEQEYMVPVIIASIVGAFLSIGGVIAVWFARFAATPTQAFAIGFWAEIIETGVFLVGYHRTVGIWAISHIDAIITLAIAVVMGFIAMKLNKSMRQAH